MLLARLQALQGAAFRAHMTTKVRSYDDKSTVDFASYDDKSTVFDDIVDVCR
jgi:hypothetical protein